MPYLLWARPLNGDATVRPRRLVLGLRAQDLCPDEGMSLLPSQYRAGEGVSSPIRHHCFLLLHSTYYPLVISSPYSFLPVIRCKMLLGAYTTLRLHTHADVRNP